MTEEELQTGKKYFMYAKIFLFSVGLFLFMWKLNMFAGVIILAVIGAVISFFVEEKISFPNKDMVYFGFFSMMFYETFNSSFNILISMVVFAFGLVSSSYTLSQKKTKLLADVKRAMLWNSTYLLFGILFLIIFGI